MVRIKGKILNLKKIDFQGMLKFAAGEVQAKHDCLGVWCVQINDGIRALMC